MTNIGDDFNLGTAALDAKLLGTTMSRVPLPLGTSAYLSLAHSKGSVIDHVISNSQQARASVIADGSFIGDHFPIIGSLGIEVLDKPSPNKRPASMPPCLRAGDSGS